MSDKNGGHGGKQSIDELRADIKQTRAELGETVQALAAKADVKARAKDQVELTKQRVKAQAAEATGKVRDAAAAAGGRMRTMASQAGDRVREANPGELGAQAREQVRSSPVPVSLVVAGALALVGLVLIMRGRRR